MRSLALLLLVACDGVGAPIVGPLPVPEGSCEVGPRCRPIRAVDPERFEVHVDAPRACDPGEIPDEPDRCVADDVAPDGCRDRPACELLIAGQRDLRGADLRGCVASIADAGDLDLSGADLSCASIAITFGELPRTIELGGALLRGASLELGSAGPLEVRADRAVLDGASLRMHGGARFSARGAALEGSVVAVAPGGGELAPSIEIVASHVVASAIVEERTGWPGRVRIERSTIFGATVRAQILELAGGAHEEVFIDAAEAHVLDVSLRASAVRADYAIFAAALLEDVIFDRCVELSFAACELVSVDVPSCEPDRLRVTGSMIAGSAIGGGAALIDTSIEASTIGWGAGGTLHTEGALLDGVGICDLAAAAFVESDLRCVRCDAGDFESGVCADGPITERGCAAIELAPSCP